MSISTDEKVSEAGAFAREVKATFPVVHDPKATITDRFGVQAIPANVLVGRDGKVLYSAEGGDVKALEAAVQKALGK